MPTIAATAPVLGHPRRTAARLEQGDPPRIAPRVGLFLALIALFGLLVFSAYRYLYLPNEMPAPAASENQLPPQPDPAASAPAQPIEESQAAPPPQPPQESESPGAADEKPEPVEPEPQTPQQAETPAPIKLPERREPVALPEETVALESNPPGAIVTVDGRARSACRTPCTVPLTPGRHSLVASMPGYRETMRTFQVPDEKAVKVVLERSTGVLGIRSTPPGASITINGQLRAEKTPTLITLPEGKYRLLVSRDGVSSEETEVEVREGSTRTINYDFQERR
jgi:hypothetical protein